MSDDMFSRFDIAYNAQHSRACTPPCDKKIITQSILYVDLFSTVVLASK